MVSLKDILQDSITIESANDLSVASICIDSRQVTKGALFVAIAGAAFDGHQFIDRAIAGGAIAILCNHPPATIRTGIT